MAFSGVGEQLGADAFMLVLSGAFDDCRLLRGRERLPGLHDVAVATVCGTWSLICVAFWEDRSCNRGVHDLSRRAWPAVFPLTVQVSGGDLAEVTVVFTEDPAFHLLVGSSLPCDDVKCGGMTKAAPEVSGAALLG